MNWEIIMYGTLVVLIVVLMYMFKDTIRSPMKNKKPDKKYSPLEEEEDKNKDTSDEYKDEKESVSKIKEIVVGEIEKEFINQALKRTRESDLKPKEGKRAVEAINTFDELMTASASLDIATEKNEIKLTEKTRKLLNLNFREEALEPFTKHAVTLRRDGAIGLSLDSLPFIAKHFKPIMTPNGNFRISNFLTMDHAVWLAAKTGTPLYIEDEYTGELATLSPEEASLLIVKKSTAQMQLEAANAKEELNKKKKEVENLTELLEAAKETSLYASDEVSRLREVTKKNEGYIQSLEDTGQRLKKENEQLIHEVERLKKMPKAMPQKDTSEHKKSKEINNNIPHSEKTNDIEISNKKSEQSNLSSEPKKSREKNHHNSNGGDGGNVKFESKKSTVINHVSEAMNSKPASISSQKMPITMVQEYLRESIAKKNIQSMFDESGVVYWGSPGAKSFIICEIEHFLKACSLWAESVNMSPFSPNNKIEKYYFYNNDKTIYFEAVKFNILIDGSYVCPNIYPRVEKYYQSKIDNGAFDIDTKQMETFKTIIADIKSGRLHYLDSQKISELENKEPF
jgi:hypothetical protein